MKRITKKILLLASAFSSVMNMNGCGAYGPPPDEQMRRPKDEPAQVVLEAEPTEENAETEPVSAPEPKHFSPNENINPCVYGPPPGH